MLKRISPNVIYVRGGWSLCAVSAYYARKSSAISVWHVASDSDLKPPTIKHIVRRPLDLIEKKGIKYAIKNSTIVIAQTLRQAKTLLERFGRKAVVVPNFHPIPYSNKKKAGMLEVLWIANFKPLKRPDLFVTLAQDLSDIKKCYIRYGWKKWLRSILKIDIGHDREIE